MKFNKKGEVDAQILKIILVIAAFLIIILLVIRFNFTKSIEDNVCRASISLQSKGGIIGGIANNAFSANCKTNYVCISGGKKCLGINPTETIKVDASDKTEIMKAIADEMVDCWWAYGEGKMAFAERETWKTNLACAACSRIVFDEKIQQTQAEISYQDFYNFLTDFKKSPSETYSQYMYNTNNVDYINNQFSGIRYNSVFRLSYIKDYIKSEDLTFNRKLDFKKDYYIIIGSARQSWFDDNSNWIFGAAATIVVGGTLLATGGTAAPIVMGISTVAKGTAIGLAGAGTVGATLIYNSVFKPTDDSYIFSPIILEADSLKEVQCQEYITLPG